MARRVLVSTLSLLFGTAAHAGFYPGHVDPGGNGSDIRASPPMSCSTFPTAASSIRRSAAGRPPIKTSVRVAATLGGQRNGLSCTATRQGLPDGPDPGFVCAGSIGSMADPRRLFRSTERSKVSTPIRWARIPDWPVQQRPCSGCNSFPAYARPDAPRRAILDDPAYLSVNDIDNFGPPGMVIFGSQCEAPQTASLTPSPEPGTLALLFSALGGGWLARRRKRDASA